jgi:uncharacterized protein Ymh
VCVVSVASVGLGVKLAKENEINKGDSDAMMDVVDLMAKTLREHPGFIWTASGFEVLHADWPAYPPGHGARVALTALTGFPEGVDFFRLDWVDSCTLFVVGDVTGDKYADRHFHIALWDDDIRELATKGYISGVSVIGLTELEYDKTGFRVTDSGQHASLYFELSKAVRAEIVNRVEDLVLQRRYDTAVRESALLLEDHLRALTGSVEFGQVLVDHCFGVNGELLPPTLTNSERLELRAIFRRYFRYVRNEFAHNFKSLSLLTTCRLLTWSSDLYTMADACSSSSRKT